MSGFNCHGKCDGCEMEDVCFPELKAAPIAVRKIAVQRLKLTAEKAALILVKRLNPWEVLTGEEEALVRGKTAKTLRGMKQNHEIPKVM